MFLDDETYRKRLLSHL